MSGATIGSDRNGKRMALRLPLPSLLIPAFFPLIGFAQAIEKIPARSWADSALASLREVRARDHVATVEVTAAMLRRYAKDGDACRLSEVYGFRSASLALTGRLDSALLCAQRALELFPPGCDSTVLMRGYLGSALVSIGTKDFARVDSICGVALGLWNPRWDARRLHFSLLTNRAIGQANLGNMDGAQNSFRTILATALYEKSPQDVNDAIANLGVMKMMLHEVDSAEYYYRLGLNNARDTRQDNLMAIGYSNLAYLKQTRNDFHRALQLADSGLACATRAEDLPMRVKLTERLAINYGKLGEFEQAYTYAERYSDADGRVRATFEIITLTGWAPHESQQKPLAPGSAKSRLADALGVEERPAGEPAPKLK